MQVRLPVAGVRLNEWKLTLELWRIVKEGLTKIVDSKKWYWCPHHKKEGVYDGMYVTHPPEKQDEWIKQKNNWGKRKSTTTNSTLASERSIPDRKLGLISNLKAAMVASFQCTQEEADKLWLDAVQNSALN